MVTRRLTTAAPDCRHAASHAHQSPGAAGDAGRDAAEPHAGRCSITVTAARSRLLTLVSMLLVAASVGHLPVASAGEREIRAAVARSVRASGYEVTERRAGHDGEVVALEMRDAYGPSTRVIFRLRSVRPWGRSSSTHFRYWLVRETYQTEERAAKRAAEYMAGYTERLASAGASRHMISKTIIRVGARRRGATVYLLVTDGAYTLYDDSGRLHPDGFGEAARPSLHAHEPGVGHRRLLRDAVPLGPLLALPRAGPGGGRAARRALVRSLPPLRRNVGPPRWRPPSFSV
jgi:hypothetical protein